MMQVRPSFVREAALLLADLAGQPDQNDQVNDADFLKALVSKFEQPDQPAIPNEKADLLMLNSAPFLVQLEGIEQPATNPKDALSAYTQRLLIGTQFDGLHWPVDLEV